MIQLIIFFKNYVLLFSLLFSGVAFSQTEEIDDLLQKAEKSYIKFQDAEEFKYARKANRLSKENNYPKGLSESYLHMALTSANLGLTKESLIFLEHAKSINYNNNDPLFQVRVKTIKAIVYAQKKLASQSLRELVEASKILEKARDTANFTKLAEIYGTIGNKHFYSNNPREAKKYYHKTRHLIETYPHKKLKALASSYYRTQAYFYMQENKDSAMYYINKSYENDVKYKKSFFAYYAALAKYYYQQKNYNLSTEYYHKLLNTIKKDSIVPMDEGLAYQKISINYDSLGDEKNKEYYQNLSDQKQNQADRQRKKDIDYVLSSILKDKEDEMNASQRKSYIWISFGILFILASLLFIYRILRKKIKQKEEKISEVTTTLEQKEKVIFEKNIEAKELKLKVNDTYNELIEFAKNNDPTFYFRFQEIYPEFHNTLLKHFPGLRNTELILCAYTFLGFSIKDIAEYTFKSVNTIRNRKQNLRKKFEVPTDQDMGIWLKNLIYPNDNQ